MSASNYDAVLFDLDGTLIDTAGHIVSSLRHALLGHMNWAPDETTLISGIGTPLDDQLILHVRNRTGEELAGSVLDTVRQSYLDHNLATHDEVVRAFDGTADALARLRARNIRVGIVTSKPVSTAKRGLEVSGLAEFFGPIVGCDSVVNHKPHPEPVYLGMKLVESTADRTLFVGDSPWDIVSGNRAGVDTAVAQWGPFDDDAFEDPPTHWFDRVELIGSI